MTRDLTNLSLQQLVALGYQNKLESMKCIPRSKTYREFLIKDLNKLEVIKGLETKEYGQQEVA